MHTAAIVLSKQACHAPRCTWMRKCHTPAAVPCRSSLACRLLLQAKAIQRLIEALCRREIAPIFRCSLARTAALLRSSAPLRPHIRMSMTPCLLRLVLPSCSEVRGVAVPLVDAFAIPGGWAEVGRGGWGWKTVLRSTERLQPTW